VLSTLLFSSYKKLKEEAKKEQQKKERKIIMNVNDIYRRGQIRWYKPYEGKDNHSGMAQKGTRPVVIIQADALNATSETFLVAPMTTSIKRNFPTHLSVTVRDKISTVLAEQIFVANKEDLDNIYYELEEYIMDLIDVVVKRAFGFLEVRQFPIEPKVYKHEYMEHEFKVYAPVEPAPIQKPIIPVSHIVTSRPITASQKPAPLTPIQKFEARASKASTKIAMSVPEIVEDRSEAKAKRRKWATKTITDFCYDYATTSPQDTATKWGMPVASVYAAYSKFRSRTEIKGEIK